MLPRTPPLVALLAMLALLPSTSRLQAGHAFVVGRAEDLHFVDLREGFLHLSGRLGAREDLLGRARAFAMDRVAHAWGIPRADQQSLAVGCVARVDAAGRLSAVMVLKGAIDAARLERKMVEAYKEDWKTMGRDPRPVQKEIAGHRAGVLGWAGRPLVDVLVPLPGAFVLATLPADDHALLAETLAVLDDPQRLREPPPKPVVLAGDFGLSGIEKQRSHAFAHEPLDARLGAVRQKFRDLHARIRSEGVDEDDLKSLQEKLNEQFLAASHHSMTLSYQPAADPADDVYELGYRLSYPSPEEALAMRDLVLEQILFFRDNSQHQGILAALDAVTVDAQGGDMLLGFRAVTREAQYDAAFAYLAFLLSFSEVDRVLGTPGAARMD